LDQVADIAILLSYLVHDLAIDLNTAVLSKMKKNEAKYPIVRSFGNDKKYNKPGC
jgi:MazG-like nucleotide pyrophosphohydrolase family protein